MQWKVVYQMRVWNVEARMADLSQYSSGSVLPSPRNWLESWQWPKFLGSLQDSVEESTNGLLISEGSINDSGTIMTEYEKC